MNSENLSVFLEKMGSDEGLKGRVLSLEGLPREEVLVAVAGISRELDVPVSVEELREVLGKEPGELAESDLEGVVGGTGLGQTLLNVAKVGFGLLDTVVNPPR